MRKISMALGFLLVSFLVTPVSAEDKPAAAPWPTGPGMMMYGAPMGVMAAHPDGYAAFLKAELAITPAQDALWERFTKVLKERSARLQTKGGWPMAPGMMQSGARGQGTGWWGMGPGMMWGSGGQAAAQARALPATLDRQVEWAEERLDSLKALRDAAKPLYDALSAEQKAKADQLLGCPVCLW